MDVLESKTTDKIYETIKTKLHADLKKLEADYRKRFGDGWMAYYAAELESKLLEKWYVSEVKGIMLEMAEKKYDALLEREHGDGRSL